MSAQTEYELEPHERALVALMERYEPVVQAPAPMRDCGGGCGRVVTVEVAVCLRCRRSSAHPALRARRSP